MWEPVKVRGMYHPAWSGTQQQFQPINVEG